MELHEWFQQLKDKVMSHLELLMQKGEIQSLLHVMSDHVKLTFLKKFIKRQAANIPHNPRLRNRQITKQLYVSRLVQGPCDITQSSATQAYTELNSDTVPSG
jgi:hypothetical protein